MELELILGMKAEVMKGSGSIIKLMAEVNIPGLMALLMKENT
jgi:hypothetical protein